MTIIRTKKGFYTSNPQKGFGIYFTPISDPEGKDINLDNAFVLAKDFPKIPARLTSAIRKLYLNLLTGSNLPHAYEVSVLLIREMRDMNNWRVLVPSQVVSMTDVKVDTAHTIDLISGEEYHCFPPPGWVHSGSSHSHNNMGAFFSPGDDESELTVPGLHFVLGRLKSLTSFEVAASITCKDHRRRLVTKDSIADWSVEEGVEFNPQVMKLIKFAEDLRSKPASTRTSELSTVLSKGTRTSIWEESYSVKNWKVSDIPIEESPLVTEIEGLVRQLYDEDPAAAIQLVDQYLPDLIDSLENPEEEERKDLSNDPFYWKP